MQTTVKPGDVVRTRAHARAEIHLGDGVIIRLRENSVLKIAKFEAKPKAVDVSLRLIAGKILLKIKRVSGLNKRIRVRTPTAVASVRGTGCRSGRGVAAGGARRVTRVSPALSIRTP